MRAKDDLVSCKTNQPQQKSLNHANDCFYFKSSVCNVFYVQFYDGIKTGEEGGGSQAAVQARERGTGVLDGGGLWRWQRG